MMAGERNLFYEMSTSGMNIFDRPPLLFLLPLSFLLFHSFNLTPVPSPPPLSSHFLCPSFLILYFFSPFLPVSPSVSLSFLPLSLSLFLSLLIYEPYSLFFSVLERLKLSPSKESVQLTSLSCDFSEPV